MAGIGLMLALAACSGGETASPGVGDSDEEDRVQWLYVLTATQVDIDGSTWTLRGVDPNVLTFSDHPAREARWEHLATLINDWAVLGFESDPPNTSVTWTDGGRPSSTAVEIANPILNGDVLSFEVTGLSGDVDLPTAPTLRSVSLTIDTVGGVLPPITPPFTDPNPECVALMAGETASPANQEYLDSVDCNLSGMDLSGLDFSGSYFDSISFANSNLTGTNMSDTTHNGTKLSGATFTGADFSGATFQSTNLQGLDLAGANLLNVSAASADLTGVDLSGHEMSGSNLSGATVSGADFTNTDLTGSNLAGLQAPDPLNPVIAYRTIMRGANLTNANLAGGNFQEATLDSSTMSGSFDGGNFKSAGFISTDLTGSIMTNTDLSGADFTDATLTNVIWSGSICPDGVQLGSGATETCNGHFRNSG